MTNIFKTYRLIFAVLLFTFTAYSCEKEVDIKLRPVPPRIMIEGMVPQDSLAKVHVSHTVDFNDNSGYPSLKGAIVKVWDDAGNSEALEQDETGWYVAENLKGEVGRTYNMSVVYDNVEYTATSKMPPRVELDSLALHKVLAMDYAIPVIYFKDPAGKENEYYRCLLYINGAQRPDVDEIVVSAEFNDGSILDLPLPVFTDNSEDSEPIKQNDEVMVEFQSVDKGAYTFFENLSRIKDSLVNPTSNIKGGALGVFSAYSYSQKSIIAQWDE